MFKTISTAAACGLPLEDVLRQLMVVSLCRQLNNFIVFLCYTATRSPSCRRCCCVGYFHPASHVQESHHGLSALDVAERRKYHGSNELSTEDEEPLWRKFVDKFKEPMIALLLASVSKPHTLLALLLRREPCWSSCNCGACTVYRATLAAACRIRC